jgi:hypothetical protein
VIFGKLPLSEVNQWDLETIHKFGDILDMKSDQESAFQAWVMRDINKK